MPEYEPQFNDDPSTKRMMENVLSVQNAENAARALPRYRCHKEVCALKIAAVEVREDKSAVISPFEAGYGHFTTAPGWGERFKGSDEDPGYYVVYEDGYTSWSPSKAFEEGYTRI